ncbi:MAG: component of SufBCD complex [Pseudorhodobacter sp.]
MQLYQTVFEVIDMRSFSNLWFWIALAVFWSTASHWVIGVPFDMVTRARKQGGQAMADLEAVVAINTRRLLYILQVSGLWLIGLAFFLLTMLLALGFVYGIEFAQALFLIFLPMTAVSALTLRAASRIERDRPEGADLCRRLTLHRVGVQAIGMLAIFVTAMWGMWQNLQFGGI